MAEQYDTNSGSFTVKEVMDALVVFLQTYGAGVWSIQKGAVGAPYGDTWNADFGTKGDPLIIGKTNTTTAEDFIIHIWEDPTRQLAFNLSEGPYNRAVGVDWTAEPNARYGTAGNAINFKPYLSRAWMNSSTIVQYHFFMYDDYVWVVWKQQDNLWRNFGFGHIEKISSFTGGAFICSSHESTNNAETQSAWNWSNSMFVDMYGVDSGAGQNDDLHIPHFRCDTQTGDFRYGCGSWINSYDAQATDGWLGADDTAASCGGMFVPAPSPIELASFEFPKMKETSTFGQTAPVIPVYFYIGMEKHSNTWGLAGKLPDVLGMNIKNFTETSIVTIQSVDYMVFPRARKTDVENTLDGFPNSYHYGFVLRVPV